MSRIVCLNGEFLAESEAKISVFDRGFLMADAVYEVSAVLEGRLLDNAGHLQRLQRSLDALNIPNPYSESAWLDLQKRLLQANQLEEGLLYLQVTRGSADRDFLFSNKMIPNVVMFTQAKNLRAAPQGLRVQIQDDIRWQRRDIKTTQLLAQSLAKMQAQAAGFDDCWFVENGLITEGSSNNAWIIAGDEAITRPASHAILNGITRRAQFQLLADLGLKLVERPFSLEEALQADEAFSTSASSFVNPVISINGHNIGSGKPGAKTLALRQAYIESALKAAA